MRPAGHVVLVGLPGAGKTTVGRELAGRMGRRFIDLDEEITAREGMSVTEIFAVHGEEYFRGREAVLTRELLTTPPAVVAPGGGWIVQPGLVELVRPPAIVVHLRVSPEAAIQRMGASAADRPLLAARSPIDQLVTLWEARRTAYQRADLEVPTDVLDVQQVTESVLSLIGWSVA